MALGSMTLFAMDAIIPGTAGSFAGLSVSLYSTNLALLFGTLVSLEIFSQTSHISSQVIYEP
jgi:hypothetical protein